MCRRQLLKEFRELYSYGRLGFCDKQDQVTGPEARNSINSTRDSLGFPGSRNSPFDCFRIESVVWALEKTTIP